MSGSLYVKDYMMVTRCRVRNKIEQEFFRVPQGSVSNLAIIIN